MIRILILPIFHIATNQIKTFDEYNGEMKTSELRYNYFCQVNKEICDLTLSYLNIKLFL